MGRHHHRRRAAAAPSRPGAVPQQWGHGCLLTSARHRQYRART